VPALGLGVAGLPLGALLVEALEPFVGLGVEALREDVVTLPYFDGSNSSV
jgi:hypothetical protein